MSDVKKALEDSGGREYIAQWLRDLNFDEKPPKSISTFLDYSLKLIDQVSWTVDLVVESRIDKVCMKDYILHRDVSDKIMHLDCEKNLQAILSL